MRTRIAALAVALAVLGSASMTTASAGVTPSTSGPTATIASSAPSEGHYAGKDAHGNRIRFNYLHGHVEHFRINHHDIGGAEVSHHRWSTSCTDAYYCSWGEWTTATQVSGAWNSGTHGGTARHFSAHWTSSHPS